ncbi:MAG: hypothetical protein KJO06_06070 [Gemmatimonadetes bacterium]|nr:hypothetical protein [Gemmatimonadota bacterium]
MAWRIPLLAILALFVAVSCDRNLPTAAPDALAGRDPGLLATDGGVTAAHAVTGSGHYVTAAGGWRTFSFQVRQKADGSVHGTFQLIAHVTPLKRWHGPLTCLSVVGNEAWVGGFYEKSTNPALLNTGFGFYVRDNGQGRNADPDLVHRHARGQEDPGDWCSSMPDVSGSEFLFPIESGNITIHDR